MRTLLCVLALAALPALLSCGGKEPAPSPSPAPPPSDPAGMHRPSGPDAVLPEGANKSCPVSGEPADPAVFLEHEGKKVYFCCDACFTTFKADPAKYFAKAYPPGDGR